MTDPKNLNKCCPTNDGNVGKAIHSLSNRIQCLERISSNIENNLDEEKSRAIDAENTLQQHIEEEQNRASTKEEEILLALNEEQRRAEAVESALSNVIESIPDAQILSDWNLSDSNARDFIKNKPLALDGKSAYELAVDNGFEGTEQEWLASLKGPQGILGETGPQGVQGIQGIQGIQGEKGDKGDKGDRGILGIQGETGPLGPKGETGETGSQGPQGIQGEKGDPFTYEDFTAAQLEALRGPLGIQGIQGEQGPQGVLGPKGADGTMTFEDLTEEQRESLRGPLGIQGPAGQDGSDGTNGQDGHSPVVTASKSGSTTTIYVDGTSIATIKDGLDGQNGTNGTNGTNGLNGVTPHIDSITKHWMIGSTDTGIVAEGQNGSNGTNGTNGTDGTDGITPTVNVTAISNGHKVAFDYGTGDSRNIDFNVMDGNVANQLQADWNLIDNTLTDYIKNKPTIPTVPSNQSAVSGGTTLSVVTTGEKYIWNNKSDFSGSYDDLTNKPIELIATGDYHRQLESLGTGIFYADSVYTHTIGSQLYKILNFNTDTNIFLFVAGGVITIFNHTSSDLVICSDKFTNNNRINGFCFNCNSASDINSDNMILLNSSFCYCNEVPFPEDNYITILVVPTSLDSYCAAIISNGEYSWKNKASIWRGTQAQYNLLTPDDNTIYIITLTS